MKGQSARRKKIIASFPLGEASVALCGVVSDVIAVLNKERKIVFCNDAALEIAGAKSQNELIGKNLADLFKCSDSAGSECGETGNCRNCGNFISVDKAFRGEKSTEEWLVNTGEKGNFVSRDFEVSAVPANIEGETFAVLCCKDISARKRMRALEKVFFHDILNTASAISGYSELINPDYDKEKLREMAAKLTAATARLIEEINTQRDIVRAERGELEVNIEETSAKHILQKAAGLYAGGIKYSSNTVIDGQAQDAPIKTDINLVCRSISMILRNAAEAVGKTKVITLSSMTENGNVIFSVHNEAHIPKDIQSQIFTRHFSTKGAGRGIGSYTAKLFTEKYLKGRIWFFSSEEKGTTFFLEYPSDF